MSDLTRIAGKPVTLTVGGQDYEFSPLTLDDLAEFEAWYASERLNRALDALGHVPEEYVPGDGSVKGEVHYSASARVELIARMSDAGSTDIATAMQSLRGVRQILWYSLRKRHPDMTPSQAGALVDFSNLGEMKSLIDNLAGIEAEETSGPPARRRSARGPAS